MSTILVIDDDLAVLKFFGTILEDAGYSVQLCHSGGDAKKLLRQTPIDLVVLDLNMPEPDGFDLLKELRAAMPGLRIVVVSGYLDGALLTAAKWLGATAVLSKSDAPGMLVKTVNDILQKFPPESG